MFDFQALSRRTLFQRTGYGLGGAALASLLSQETRAANREAASVKRHVPPRAKSVIYIHLVGAPSHLDLFDYKPELQQRTGQLCPDEFFVGKQLAFIRTQPKLLGTPTDERFAFRRCGESGNEISGLLPYLQSVADELCLIKTLHTEQFNHAPAQLFLLSGFGRFGRPSLGSWVTYGLGTENQDLPAFVVLITGQVLGAGNSAWGSGFLPTVYQGVEFRTQGDPVLFLSDPPGVTAEDRRELIAAANRLNQAQLADVGDPEIATRISQYELAYRMQSSVPELMDLRGETKATLDLYGAAPGKPTFANNCLLARRLVERGVRFVQLFDEGWDHHGNVFQALPNKCNQVDKPIAALLTDLKQRGLLDETLVVWSAEFGRTPMAQATGETGENQRVGRDHHKDAYTVWLAGGGVKRGITYGETDPLGYGLVNDGVHVHDFNATILHLLGLDHERLTFKYQGRDYRLTDVHGEVVQSILA
jgi:hypothetical protein